MTVKELMEMLSSCNSDKQVMVDVALENDRSIAFDINDEVMEEDEEFIYLKAYFVDREE